MTTFEPDELGKTAPIELPASGPSLPPLTSGPGATPVDTEPHPALPEDAPASRAVYSAVEAESRSVVLRPASAAQQEVLFIPLAVTVGDGFKFGCGFFLALVLAMLVGFVLMAVLFVLTSLFGLNVPLSR